MQWCCGVCSIARGISSGLVLGEFGFVDVYTDLRQEGSSCP